MLARSLVRDALDLANSLITSEVRSLLKEIRAIGKMNLVGSLPDDVLARVRLIMQQAVQEARIIVKGASGHGTKIGPINDRFRAIPDSQGHLRQ